MCTCSELPFEGLCQTCVEEIYAEEAAQMAIISADVDYPSEDELPF